MTGPPRSKHGIFRPICVDGIEIFTSIEPLAFQIFSRHVGYSLRDGWRPIEVVRHTVDDDGTPLRAADFPCGSASGALVMCQSAVAAMNDVWSEYGELLPLLCADAELVAFHPLLAIEAIDEAQSSLVRFDDGRILAVTEYVFRPEKVRNTLIFQTPQRPTELFVSGEFVTLVERLNLHGLEFTHLWSPG